MIQNQLVLRRMKKTKALSIANLLLDFYRDDPSAAVERSWAHALGPTENYESLPLCDIHSPRVLKLGHMLNPVQFYCKHSILYLGIERE